MFWLKVVLYSMLLALAGCGGDSAPNNDNSNGSGGDITEVTPPTIQPSSKSIRAADFHLTFNTNAAIDALNVNFSTFVSSMENKPLSITEIVALSKDAHCQILSSEPKRLQFAVSPKTAKTCVYHYVVTDGITSNEGIGRVTFSANQSNKTQKALSGASALSSVLLPVSKSTTLGETLTFSLAAELSTQLTLMTHPLFSEAIAAYGTGVPIVTESGDVTYKAVATGSSLSYFHILDDQNTPDDKSDDIIYNGTLIIDVSGATNNPPIASDLDLSSSSEVLIPAGNEVTLDVANFLSFGSLIDDVDHDSVQLISIHSENAFVELFSPLDVNNTKFRFNSTTPGTKTIVYTVYDHNINGISSGIITLNVGETLSGRLYISENGVAKYFPDHKMLGVLASTTNRGDDVFKEVIYPYLINNSLDVLQVVKQTKSAYGLYLSNGELIVFSQLPNGSFPYGEYWKIFNNVRTTTLTPYRTQHVSDTVASKFSYIVHNDNSLDYFVSNTTFPSYLNEAVETLIFPKPVKLIQSLERNFAVTFDDNSRAIYILDSKTKSFHQYSIDVSVNRIIPVANDFLLVAVDGSWSSLLGSTLPLFTKLSGKKIKLAYRDEWSVFVLTQDSTLYMNFDKVYKNDILELKNIKYFKPGSSFVAAITNDGYLVGKSHENFFATDKSAVTYRIEPDFSLLPRIKSDDLLGYISGSDALAYITKDKKLYILTHDELRYVGNGYVSVSSEIVKGLGHYRTEYPHYLVNNTFIAMQDDLSWHFIEGTTGYPTFGCPAIDLSSYDNPVLFARCSVYDLKNNGTITLNTSRKAFPEYLMSDSLNKLPLDDVDSDGLTNTLENELCIKMQFQKVSNSVFCESPVLSDSDGDGVFDLLERTYQTPDLTIGNPLSSFSFMNENYDDTMINRVSDTLSDINKNGTYDYLE